MSRESVRTARSGDNHLSPETITGRDGKEYPARRRAGDVALESSDNSESDGGSEAEDQESAVAHPAIIEDNILHSLGRMNALAKMFKKHIKLSAFDRERKERISAAIDETIQKLRLTQAALGVD
jgi:hypothetical protein